MPLHQMRSTSHSEDETTRLGTGLARQLKAGDIIGLSGPLGAGKSVLARGIIRNLMCDPDLVVPSPSFTLVQIYALPNGHDLWHVDLYRLEHPDDLLELGLEDAFDDSIMLVEWPDRARSLLPKDHLGLELAIKDNDARLVTAQANQSWHQRIGHLFPTTGKKTP